MGLVTRSVLALLSYPILSLAVSLSYHFIAQLRTDSKSSELTLTWLRSNLRRGNASGEARLLLHCPSLAFR